MTRALLVVALLWSTPASAEDGLRLHVALTAFMAAQGADLSTTMYCAGAQRCREANPIMAPFFTRPIAMGAVKMGTAALTSWALIHFHAKHPRLTFWLATAGTVGLSVVAARNARITP